MCYNFTDAQYPNGVNSMIAEPELKQRLTVEEFEAWVELPENHDRLFEFIGGEIVEVPSNAFVSEIASLISFFVRLFLVNNNLKGHVTGEAGGYMVNGERYAPDVAYISYDRQPELAHRGYNPNPPELAVEIISDPTSIKEQEALRRKLANYWAAGVLLWVVNPFDRFVEVYQPGKPMQVLDEKGILDGGDVLTGFTLAVADILPKISPETTTPSA